MALFALVYLHFKHMNLWRKHDSYVILVHVDQLYKSLKRTDYLNSNDLPHSVQGNSVKVEVK